MLVFLYGGDILFLEEVELPQKVGVVLFKFLYFSLELFVSEGCGLDILIHYLLDLHYLLNNPLHLNRPLNVDWLYLYFLLHLFSLLQFLT